MTDWEDMTAQRNRTGEATDRGKVKSRGRGSTGNNGRRIEGRGREAKRLGEGHLGGKEKT
jgi:hypothetical protein